MDGRLMAGTLGGTQKALLFCGVAVALVVSASSAIGSHGFAVLHDFGSGSDGISPYAALAAHGGNLYGTAISGGAGYGTVFMITAAGVESDLYTFAGGSDGSDPQGGIAIDSRGNLYGTTYHGGSNDAGTVYRLDSQGNETVLYSFTGGSDGSNPQGTPVLDASRNLYGTAAKGGGGGGVVFKVTRTGRYSVLHAFSGNPDGNLPTGPLLRDAAGDLYGTTYLGGSNNAGSVFKVAADGTESVLYSFGGGSDGGYPWGGVIEDSDGNLYGTTLLGGPTDDGTVFKLAPGGSLQTLYSFKGRKDGLEPYCSLVQDSAGNLYGTARLGGANGGGVVFKLTPAGDETVLHAFTNTDGAQPTSGLTPRQSGATLLFGTTVYGGSANYGTVFQVRE